MFSKYDRVIGSPRYEMNGLLTIEACVASIAAAKTAGAAGANRIELNLALELDGLTPSAGLVSSVVREINIPVIAMARPRAGDFLYSDDEWATLVADAGWLLNNGVAGIAFGALTGANKIDPARCQQIRELAGSAELVFHKAFDSVPDASEALEILIQTGIDRVMTSGLAATAIEGASVIAGLVKQAAGRIEILPAGRIASQNFSELLESTGCDQIHGSFSQGGGLGEEIRAIRQRFV